MLYAALAARRFMYVVLSSSYVLRAASDVPSAFSVYLYERSIRSS